MLNYERPQTVDFMGPKAVGLRKADRLQPEFPDAIITFNMYVRRLGSLKTVREEAKAGYTQHSWH